MRPTPSPNTIAAAGSGVGAGGFNSRRAATGSSRARAACAAPAPITSGAATRDAASTQPKPCRRIEAIINTSGEVMGPMDISSNCLWSGSDRILGVKTPHFDLVQPRCGLRRAGRYFNPLFDSRAARRKRGVGETRTWVATRPPGRYLPEMIFPAEIPPRRAFKWTVCSGVHRHAEH